MQIAWLWGLLGGAMIGLAGAIFLLGAGRIMGASGLIGGLVDGSARGRAGQNLAFVAGTIAVPALLIAAFGSVQTHLGGPSIGLVAAGLLVGLGTRLANGCTSGHGVCGISRLARRGLAATGLFIVSGMLSLLLFRHGLGWI